MALIVSCILIYYIILVIEKLLSICNCDHKDKIITLLKNNKNMLYETTLGKQFEEKFIRSSSNDKYLNRKYNDNSISTILNESSDKDNSIDNHSINDYLINNLRISDKGN